MIPHGLLEFTHRKCIHIDGGVFSYTRFMEQLSYDDVPELEMLNVASASSAVGGWNALTTSRWIELGGWNEDMYGWGFEDQELHSRLASSNIDVIFTNSFPLVHINHDVRNSDHVDTQRRNIKIANSSTTKNWLRD